MPGGDGTGPFGTLRNCIPVNTNQAQAPFYGRRGIGRRGMGRGFRWCFLETGVPGWAAGQSQQSVPVQETQAKPMQNKDEKIRQLETELEKIKQKINELKGD